MIVKLIDDSNNRKYRKIRYHLIEVDNISLTAIDKIRSNEIYVFNVSAEKNINLLLQEGKMIKGIHFAYKKDYFSYIIKTEAFETAKKYLFLTDKNYIDEILIIQLDMIRSKLFSMINVDDIETILPRRFKVSCSLLIRKEQLIEIYESNDIETKDFAKKALETLGIIEWGYYC